MGLGGWLVGAAAPAMLWGLLAVAIPVLIHLLNRRRAVVIDWGAMPFLALGRRAHRRSRLAELPLMLGRMILLALVALALARPFVAPRDAAPGDAASEALGSSVAAGEPRDVAIILDGSESMARL